VLVINQIQIGFATPTDHHIFKPDLLDGDRRVESTARATYLNFELVQI